MTTESQILRQRMEEGPQAAGPQATAVPTIDGVPMDSFATQQRAAKEQGGTLLQNDDGTPYDPENKGLLFQGPEEETLLFPQNTRKQISANYAWNKGHEDAVLNGDLDSTGDRAREYLANTSVKDNLIEMLYSMYTNDHLNYGVLTDIAGMEPDEQIARIMHEVDRLDLKKLSSKQNLLIHMMRTGFGSLPQKAAEETWMTLDTKELEAIGDNMRKEQTTQLRLEIDALAAPLGTDFTMKAGIEEILQQDFVPVFGAVTRVLTTKKFIPSDVEIGTFRGILPGEVRNDIREWFAQASHEERVDYVRGIATEVENLRKGPNAALFTRYGILENVIGIFTDDLLDENMSKDSLDRWMGNLDVALEAVYAAGLAAKLGSSLAGLFRTTNVSSVRQAAKAAGNNATVAQLDTQIRKAASEFGVTPAEASIIDLPRPAGLRDNMEILLDGAKEVIDQSEVFRARILANTEDVTGQGLTRGDKGNVIRKTIKDLDWGDGVHVNYRMMTIESLPKNVGFKVTAVVGETPTGGWKYFDDMVDEILDIDPNLEVFEIVRRSGSGTVEALGITANDIATFATKGQVPLMVEQRLAPAHATSRLFGGRRLSTIPQEDLVVTLNAGTAPQQDIDNILKELERRAAGIDAVDPLRSLDGDEFFLRMSQDRFWHTLDKDGFNAETFLNTGLTPRPLLAPNSKFGDDIYGAFHRVYLKELTSVRDFNLIYKPYYDLSNPDKLVVENMFEWAEDFAKAQADRGLARAPTFEELAVAFDGLTLGQMKGYAAIRQGLDTQYDLFNRRLFRDMHTRGLKTARAVSDDSLPNYHGVPIAQGTVKPGKYFDPVANELKQLDQADVDDIFNGGGSFLRLDFPIDAPTSGKFDRILIRSGDYQTGSLSRRPLAYYEGYHMRFYEDPVYIIKHTDGAEVNGVKTKKGFTEAIRTAGSTPEAERFINKYATKEVDSLGRFKDSKDPRVSYEVRPAKDINNTEGTLFQQQALYREGRMFWDSRNIERLPDVNGNRARVQDLTRGLQKGTAMAVRQSTHEDLMTTLKTAFGREYSDIISKQDLSTKDLKTIISELRAIRRSSTSAGARRRINDAIEVAKYLRLQLGTDSSVIPALREATIQMANWIGRQGVRYDNKALLKMGSMAEQFGQQVDPFRTARSIAFHTFIVFMPVRQLALQSAQISYLLPLDPSYIGTGRVFKDSLALRRGIKRITTMNYADGWSDTHWAEVMGLSRKEYKRLVEEFNRSGLLETVDVHTFNSSARQATKIGLKDTHLSRGYNQLRGAVKGTRDTFQKGFDIGEKNNLTFTYMVALRRALKNTNTNSLTSFTRTDWDAIAIDASNLALAMTRPNKFGYQGGAIGVMTQFLSFSHKAALGVLGKNPAISNKEGMKILLSGYLLFGSNIFGAEDEAREYLAQMGLSRHTEAEILPGISLADLMTAGLIESGFNAILTATTEEQKELDLGFLAPGANIVQIYETVLEAVSESPEKGLLGPFYNPASGFLKGVEFTRNMVQHSDRSPSEKFTKSADALLRNTLSGYNHANRAMLAYTMGQWLDKDGDKLPLRPVLNTILARGLLGVHSEEAMAYNKLQDAAWENVNNINNAVDTNKAFLKELLTGWQGKQYGDAYIYEQVAVLNSLYEQWPEGIRREIFIRSLNEGDEATPSIVEIIAKMAGEGSATLGAIAPWIDAQADMTPKEKQQLLQFVEEAQRGHTGADTLFRDLQLQDGNKE